jgi:hypothetical protein
LAIANSTLKGHDNTAQGRALRRPGLRAA